MTRMFQRSPRVRSPSSAAPAAATIQSRGSAATAGRNGRRSRITSRGPAARKAVWPPRPPAASRSPRPPRSPPRAKAQARVAPAEPISTEALDRDDGQRGAGRGVTIAAAASSLQKPGPSASSRPRRRPAGGARRACPAAPAAPRRGEVADVAGRLSQVSASASGGSPSASSIAASTFGPPGWTDAGGDVARARARARQEGVDVAARYCCDHFGTSAESTIRKPLSDVPAHDVARCRGRRSSAWPPTSAAPAAGARRAGERPPPPPRRRTARTR